MRHRIIPVLVTSIRNNKIIRWKPTNAGEENTSFTTQFEAKFKTAILISKWHMELEKRTQGPGEVVTEYAKAIRKLIKRIHSFTKRLRTDLLIEDNQRMHLGSTLPVFASAPVMALAPQMAAVSFAAQTQDPNEQLINRLIANLAQLLKPLAQAVRENQQPQKPRFELHFNQPQQFPYQRQQNRGPPVTINNNVPNQRPNYANINFFGENPLVEATSESTSQPEKNPFYVFNLTDNDHNMDELAINISESTRKKKKAKIDFILDSKKVFTSTADNNEPLKAKNFKNPSKLELPEIVQKSGPYSVVKDLMEMPVHITFGQLMTHPQFKKDLYKLLIPKKKTPKTNKCLCQAGLADNSNVTSLICKAQVAGYFIDLILNSGSSVSVIAKHFLEAIGRKIDEPSTRPMTNIHGNKKKGLGIAKAISVRINGISIETDMKVSEAKEYTIIVGNKWLKKAKAFFNYELCKLIIRCGKKPIVVKCCHWTTPPATKQNQEKEQSDESDDNKSDNEKDQKEQKKTVELTYIIFTSNGKPLNNVKADKKRIMVNGKLICWPYYNIFRRTFDRKPSKKAKYNWEPISLILQEELKKVQKSFENKPPEIQLLVIEQRELSSKEKKVDIENLLARNSPVISKESNTPG
ncbi:hypothetical protein G9A89_005561 [Geosiphon pyriformis]|nr:hypothetical protein G9A89_005561 [Geosiphon pyriformis]